MVSAYTSARQNIIMKRKNNKMSNAIVNDNNNKVNFSFEQFKAKVENAIAISKQEISISFENDIDKKQYKAIIFDNPVLLVFGRPSTSKICVIVNRKKLYM